MKIVTILVLILSLALCALWPLLLGFGFDEPLKSEAAQFRRLIGMGILLLYPWGLVVGLIRIERLKESKAAWADSTTCLLLAAPYAHLAIFSGILSLWH